jgi:hypothetical protein
MEETRLARIPGTALEAVRPPGLANCIRPETGARRPKLTLKRKDHIDDRRQPCPQLFKRPDDVETNRRQQIRGAKNKKQMDWNQPQ